MPNRFRCALAIALMNPFLWAKGVGYGKKHLLVMFNWVSVLVGSLAASEGCWSVSLCLQNVGSVLIRQVLLSCSITVQLWNKIHMEGGEQVFHS